MGVARSLERRLERLVDGLSSQLFRGRIQPVELGSRLVREADLERFDTTAGPGAPNAFQVVLGGEAVEADLLETVGAEIARYVDDAAADRGWRLEGPAKVRIEIDTGRRPAYVDVAARVESGPRAPWALLVPAGSAPILEVTVNRSVIGRSRDADLRLAQEDVSRRHALLWRESGSVWLADLGSSNGTFVEGERVGEPVALGGSERVAFGEQVFWFEPAS
jgi:hypothetical protein